MLTGLYLTHHDTVGTKGVGAEVAELATRTALAQQVLAATASRVAARQTVRSIDSDHPHSERGYWIIRNSLQNMHVRTAAMRIIHINISLCIIAEGWTSG